MVLVFAVASLAFAALQKPHKADATINRQINFQGKIVFNSNGTNISNGTYNMEFKIYSGGDGVVGGGDETLLWTEDRLVGGTGGVTITDGIFQANLGSVTSLPGSVDFNASTIWLSMQIGNTSSCTILTNFQTNCSGDAEMSPMVRFTAAPYAFNSDTLDGIDSTAFGQLSSNNTWTGTQTLQPTTNITSAIIKQTSVGSPTANIFNIQTANSTNILQVTGPAANEAAVTLASVGATRDLTLDSASGTLKLGSNTTTLQKSGTAFTFDVNSGSNSTLTVTNAGAGVASLSVEGNISTTATISANDFDRTTSGTLTFGNTNASTINVATTDITHTINIGTGGSSNAQTITLGSNNSGSSLTLQSGSAGVLIKPANGTTALQVQRSSNSDVSLAVDTTNNRVVIGNATASAGSDTTLFVVDSAATANAPTGTNGGIYYNSSLNKFQCYQNSAWSDCFTNVVYASSTSTQSIVSGLANVTASQTGTPVETMVFTSATAVSNTAGATGFTAPANGSFRSCLIKNNANITAGNLSLRWRVNGSSVGSATCNMDSTAALRRSSSAVLDSGTVTFSAGDTIGIAFDTDAGYLPITADYTVFWTVEYQSTTGSALNLQYVYDSSASPALINTTDAKNIQFGLTDTTTDANFLVNAATGSTGKFAVQYAGTDVFSVNPSTGDTATTGHFAAGNTASPSLPVVAVLSETFSGSTNCGFGCYGLQSFVTIDNPASPARGVGILSKVSTGASSFTLTEADALLIQNGTLGAGSTITTNVGLRIDNLTNGTNDYAISLGGADTADILFETDRTHILKVQDQDTAATAGSDLQVTGANGNTSGAGGAISITSGNGGGTGATNAGTITINNGTVSGAGTATINIGTANTTALNLGNSAGAATVTGSSGSNFILNGTTVSAAEFNVLDNGIERGDLTTQGTATDEFCLTSETGGGALLEWQACGGGDSISVNGSAATDANFLDTAATGTVTGVTFTLNTGPSPDTISIAIGNASTTVAGAVTTGSQTFAGDKTFQSTSDSATALQVTDHLTNQIFAVDTLHGNFGVGDCSGTGVNSRTCISAGSVILGGSGGGAFADFYQGGNVPLTINTSHGIEIQDNGTTVGTISSSGLVIQSSVNGTSGLRVADSSGTGILNVSTATLSLTNLIPFPSFENGNSNGWAVHGTGTGASVVASTDFANFGSYSLKIITGTTASGTEYRYPLKASTQYSLSFWARLSSGSSASGEFNAGRNDNPGSLGTATGDTACTTTPDISLTSAVTTTWTQYTCTFTSGGTIGPSSNIYIKQTDTTTSTLYVDGITLVEAATGLSFTPVASGLDFNNYTDSLVFNGNASGELHPWRLNDKPIGATTSTDTTNRVVGHEGSATITANGYVYVLGGYDGTNTLNGVWYAKVNADGSVGTWSCQGTAAATSCGTSASPTNANNMPAARRLLTAVLANGYIYAIGGFDGSASVSTVYYAKLNSDGSTGTWQTNPYAIGQAVAGTAQARVAPSAAVLNGYIYVVGGCSDAAAATCATPQSTVYYAKVNADGSTNSWTTNANALTAAKGMGTVAIANGYMYYIGGATNATTVSGNVYCAAIAANGSIGSFGTTSCNSLPSNRAQQATFVLNGFLYVIGGCSVIASASCTTATNTVWYAPLNGDGTLGTWVAATNTLPANRGGSSFFSGNSYVYMLGGHNASARQSTIYYTSTPRTFIAGGLDLIGLNSQTTSDAGGGGSLTAGNTSIVGALRVDGYADFNNGVSVDSALNVNAVSATAGQTVFNINNSSANSIFSVRHMGTNFGSLVTGGAFMQKNSYFGEEFNISPVNASQTCLANATETNAGWSRGDLGSHNNAAVTCGTSLDQFSGEFNWSTKNGAATAGQGCTVAYQNGGTVNGIERISAASTATAANAASCTEALAATRTTSNKIFLAANLPVATYKVKASTLTASQNTDRIRIGLSNVNTATAMGSPTDGIFFSNCSTESTTTGSVSGCSNTTWYGHSFSGSAEVSGGPVTCSVGSGSLTAQFSYLRIEVRASNDVHFYADYNAADGINEVECGTGIATASTSAALTTWTHVTVATNAARTVAADIDYIRIWQDDNVPIESAAPENTTETPSGEDIISAPPLVTDADSDEAENSLFSFSAATSEDAMFEKDVYIKGTLFADKIKANQIEGLEILTDKINSLNAQLSGDQEIHPTGTSGSGTPASSGGITIGGIGPVSMQSAVVTLNLQVGGSILAGGLTLNGPAEFNGDSIFNRLVTFVDDINVLGRATFNNDTGGFATIYPGQQEVKIKFAKEYKDTPVVTASIKNGQFVQYSIKDLDKKGFTITLKDPAENETQFTWTALSVKDAQTAQVLPPPNP